jgi:hypothetical protein
MAFGAMVTASTGIADSDQGLVGGVINTSRQLGAALGAALLPAVADAVDRTGHSSLAAGDRAAMLAGAVAAGLATLVALNARRKTSHTPAHIRHPPEPATWPAVPCPWSPPGPATSTTISTKARPGPSQPRPVSHHTGSPWRHSPQSRRAPHPWRTGALFHRDPERRISHVHGHHRHRDRQRPPRSARPEADGNEIGTFPAHPGPAIHARPEPTSSSCPGPVATWPGTNCCQGCSPPGRAIIATVGTAQRTGS